MRPSSGSSVSAVTPASSSAFELTQRRVAVAALEVDRAIRHDAIEVGAVRDAAREIGHRPAVAADPRLVRVRGGVGGDDPEIRLEPARGRQVAAHLADAGRDRMDVRIPEARGHRPAAQLHDPGPRPDPVAHGIVATDRDDPPGPNGEGGGERAFRVHRRDAAAAQDEVGWSVVGHRLDRRARMFSRT